MIHATRREFERAFRFHLSLAGTCVTTSQRLLLVYAVECGLKALIMANEGVEITSRLKTDIGHDIREGLKRLRSTLVVRQVRTQQQVPQLVQPRQLHEAFRYAILIDDQQVIPELIRVVEWIRQRL